MVENNTPMIKGSCVGHCKQASRLVESIGEQLLEVAEAEDIARSNERFLLVPMVNVPGRVISNVEEHLKEHPCRYVITGECEIANYAVDRLARD